MPGFKSSVNLQFDLDDDNLLRRYILSPSHSEAFRGIVESFLSVRGMHSHLLIGPYGTGKSLVSSIVCKLFSKQISPELFTSFLEQAERLDTQLSNLLIQIQDNPTTYIPVIINGKTGNLRKIINSAIYHSLNHAGEKITTTNEIASILKMIVLWKESYPQTYHQFLQHVESLRMNEDEWKALIESYDEELILKFKEFYPTVTSGSQWFSDEEEQFVENIQRILEELKKRSKGLLIVYDEFGRFLQSMHMQNSNQSMQDLQDLAELANSSSNMQLLVVGHKHIRQYAVQSKENTRLEFEKVEKRFRFYAFETDPNTYLRLAHEAATSINQLCLEDDTLLESTKALQFFPLFSEYTPHQLDNYVIRGMYPLHPVAVVLLPYLSNVLGQNERTLFSFFQDEERYALSHHVIHDDGYYYADKLFYYFVEGNEEKTEHSDLHLYQKVIQFVSQDNLLQRRIVQFIALWSISSLSSKQPLTTNFISFALGIDVELTNDQLLGLSSQKIIRFNQIILQWELFEGSSVNLEKIINEKLFSTVLSKKKKIEILEKQLSLKYVLPYEYNDEVSMLRYGQIEFAWISDIKTSLSKELQADDRIIFVLVEHLEQLEQIESLISRENNNVIFAVPGFTSENIEIALQKFSIVEQLMNDPSFISLDSRLMSELEFMLQEINYQVRSFVDQYLRFKELVWWAEGNHYHINDLWELEQFISQRMMAKFPSTPIIRNESFNRQKISSVQRRSAIDVIDRLLNTPYEPNLGIPGYGPNYMIYASVLKNNDYQFNTEKELLCNSTLQVLRNALKEVLIEQSKGKLIDLVRVFTLPPFGIRTSVIPVLFVALLRDVWEQLMFYAHDMHVSNLNGTAIYELVERAEEYEYRYYNISLKEQGKLIHIGRVFGMDSKSSSNILFVSKTMLKWIQSLPKFTQITYQLSDMSIELRELIRRAEIDPYRLLRELTVGEETIAQAKEELEQFLESNKRYLNEQILVLTKCDSIEEFATIIHNSRVQVVGMSSKLLTLPEAVESKNEFLDILIQHIVGVARTEWSDATQELFLKQLTYEWQLLQSTVEVASTDSIHIQPQTIELSKKTQLLYTNVKNILKYAGKDITTQEIKYLLMKLIQEVE
ncbi:hypothetical protein [Paenibacillus sp. OAS669]|uniref:hypothetical protein n=1 Tax=Paenibacillus sp. OAS669 TaxID=2663821 RepID=UPI00178AD8E7|nr:hypothetical protein [Paenibacillus sp. OAS669]MBE1444852.1 hypothetical protein [Paenibacillus sp. OAS669]